MCLVLVLSELLLSTHLPTSDGWTAELTVGWWLVVPRTGFEPTRVDLACFETLRLNHTATPSLLALLSCNSNNDDNRPIMSIKIQKMWYLKAIVIPVVFGALGMVKKKTEDHIKRIPGNLRLQKLQKIILNETAHLLRRVLTM